MANTTVDTMDVQGTVASAHEVGLSAVEVPSSNQGVGSVRLVGSRLVLSRWLDDEGYEIPAHLG